jgi:hypothetical protein
MDAIKHLSNLQREGGQEEIKLAPLTESSAWPEALAPEAYHGPLGGFVKLVEPHTESDPAALLMQAIVAAGNAIGRQAHFRIEADEHYANEFVVIVGESARGRKGTSLGYVKRLFKDVDPTWAANCIVSGLSSGEGLIHVVRDAVTEIDNSDSGENKIRTVDPGVADKRCLAVETEFGGVLRTLPREGNRLSAILRDAWDSGDLRSVTKSSPTRATGGHVSCIGHITRQELKRYISDVDLFNGFANRFLWVASKRARRLPLGGKFEESALEPIREDLRRAMLFAVKRRELRFSTDAEAFWIRIYEALDSEIPGILGVLSARAPAHIIRVSVIFAVLDCSDEVSLEHLTAALAVWDYCYNSCKYVFGRSTGDRVADRIHEELLVRPRGITQTEIFKLFGNNKGKTEIAQALTMLERHGLIHSMVEGGAGVKSVTRWMKGIRDAVTNYEFNEIDESDELPLSKNSLSS